MANKKDKQYRLMELTEADLHTDPIEQFAIWYKEAGESGFPFPNSFILSTSDKKGHISSRVLLLKEFNKNGFKFYTNESSKKGKELNANNNASICFWWDRLERQVRIEGTVSGLSNSESDKYFKTRPRGSQLGAWASDQSSVIKDRSVLDKAYKEFDKKYENKDIPRPQFWKGYLLSPLCIEFWQGRENRLHDRFLYTRNDSIWNIERLAP